MDDSILLPESNQDPSHGNDDDEAVPVKLEFINNNSNNSNNNNWKLIIIIIVIISIQNLKSEQQIETDGGFNFDNN
jgi:hypothetical protein